MLIVKKMRVGLQGNEIKFENNLQQFCHNARHEKGTESPRHIFSVHNIQEMAKVY